MELIDMVKGTLVGVALFYIAIIGEAMLSSHKTVLYFVIVIFLILYSLYFLVRIKPQENNNQDSNVEEYYEEIFKESQKWLKQKLSGRI
jgi:uncharacterized membrane protein